MQQIDNSHGNLALASAAHMARASYSAGSLIRRALLGLFLIALFTSTSAWLLHATTTEPAPQTSAQRQP